MIAGTPEHVVGTDRWRFTLDGEALRKALATGDGPVGKAMLRLVLKAEASAKRRCPVDTGRLRSSINHRVEQEGDNIVGIIGTNVEYAPHVEFGTRNADNSVRTEPAGFLRGGIDEALRTLGAP